MQQHRKFLDGRGCIQLKYNVRMLEDMQTFSQDGLIANLISQGLSEHEILLFLLGIIKCNGSEIQS